jgi:cob(I)alamin adenosyltransferase
VTAESGSTSDDDSSSEATPRRRGTRRARVTTRTGDDGYTGLLGKERVPKWHPRPESFGTLDEATSALGLARALTPFEEVRAVILDLQRELYLLMAELATGPDEYERSPFRITAEHVASLEARSALLQEKVEIGQQFIIPGETAGGAALDLARTIVRRGERLVARLLHDGEIGNRDVLRYLNRVSDVLFILARYEESLTGRESRPSRESTDRT